jgi:hypothetical protein
VYDGHRLEAGGHAFDEGMSNDVGAWPLKQGIRARAVVALRDAPTGGEDDSINGPTVQPLCQVEAAGPTLFLRVEPKVFEPL